MQTGKKKPGSIVSWCPGSRSHDLHALHCRADSILYGYLQLTVTLYEFGQQLHLACDEEFHIRITGSNLQHRREIELLHHFRNEARSGHEAKISFGLQVTEHRQKLTAIVVQALIQSIDDHVDFGVTGNYRLKYTQDLFKRWPCPAVCMAVV
jgi:hypothetical protein